MLFILAYFSYPSQSLLAKDKKKYVPSKYYKTASTYKKWKCFVLASSKKYNNNF